MPFLQGSTCSGEHKGSLQDCGPSPTLGNFFNVLCRTGRTSFKKASKNVPSFIISQFDSPLIEVVKKDCFDLVYLQEAAGVPFVIKQKTYRRWSHLLYDGRHLRKQPENRPFHKKFGVWYLLFDRDKQLVKSSKNISSCPKNHLLPTKTDQTVTLAQLLNIEGNSAPDPQDYDETIDWLSQQGLLHTVQIHYCIRVLPVAIPCLWISPSLSMPTPTVLTNYVHLEAYTGKNHKLRFREKRHLKKSGPKPAPVLSKDDKGETNEELEKVDPIAQEHSALRQDNRACGTHVELSGLTKAYKLGMLAGGKDFLITASKEMSKAVGTLWFHYDCDSNVRHIGYRDGLGFFKTWEIFPNRLFNNSPLELKSSPTQKDVNNIQKCWESWKVVFDNLWDRQQEIRQHKEKFLGPLISLWEMSLQSGEGPKLPQEGEEEEEQQEGMKKRRAKRPQGKKCKSKPLNGVGGAYSRCIASLKLCVKKMKIVCFCESDLMMHSIKMPLAHYLSTVVGNNRGLTIRTYAKTKIVCLSSGTIEVQNLASCLGFKCNEENFFKDEGLDLISICSEWVSGGEKNYLSQQDLYPKPLLDSSIRSLHNQGMLYCPGRVAGYAKGSETCLRQRAEILTRVTLSLYKEFSNWICKNYSLDLTTFSYLSLSSIAFKCVWLSFSEKGGALCQSLEKTKPQYNKILRKLCKGGFAYSCQGTLSSGEALSNNDEDSTTSGNIEKAVSIREYDLTSAYGFSACNASLPAGFCIGFSNTLPKSELGTGRVELQRTDKNTRAASFEYSATVTTLQGFESEGHKIMAVWSNYSPLGLCYVGKHPLDLVVVTEGGTVYFVNFDGVFVHGCRTGQCPPLRTYVGGQTLEQVLQKTRERDRCVEEWIAINTATNRLKSVYIVLSSCHDAEVNLNFLHNSNIHHKLALLREPYLSLPKDCITSVDFFYNTHPGLTFLLVGKGGIPLEKRKSEKAPPLMVWKRGFDEQGREKHYQDFAWESKEDTLYTLDTLLHLTTCFGFRLSEVTHCFFYRKCTTLPLVFHSLTEERQRLTGAGCTAKAKFIKSLVNYSTGMFGYNAEKRSTAGFKSVRLVSKLSQKNLDLIRMEVHVVGTIQEKSYQLVQTRGRGKLEGAPLPNWNTSALPLYAAIVEYGKGRLLDCHTFITWGVRPGAYRCLYSNTDNLVCSLSSPTLEEALRPSRRDRFLKRQNDYFGCEPGNLSEKWSIQAPWNFASPYLCTYSVLQTHDAQGQSEKGEEGKGQCKTAGFKGLSLTEAHTSNVVILKGNSENALSRLQKRRVNSLLDTSVKEVEVRMPKVRRIASD